MKNCYKLSTIKKKSLIISLISALIGGLQMAIFLPDGVSCLNGTSSLFDGILFFMLIQLFIVLHQSNSKTIDQSF